MQDKPKKTCAKCHLMIQGQFVRAVKCHYHLDCFRCQDCNDLVADKFFPVQSDGITMIYCEKDYFKKLELICARCEQALRGPYIRVNQQKYHMEHFSCSVCATLFRQHDSYYEKDGNIYCGLHYSILFALKCGGCNTAVLKNFVETTKDDKVSQWHPCCYMISKLWNIRLYNPDYPQPEEVKVDLDLQIQKQHQMVEKVETILQILSSFEESAAECISEMLVHFTNGGYINGAVHAHRLIAHVQVLFSSLEEIDDKLNAVNDPQNLSKSKEPKQLIKKIVYFFSILSSQQDLIERQAATRDMIQLVTSLAHVLKIIIRNSLAGALRLEQLHKDTQTIQILLSRLQQARSDEYSTFLSHLAITVKDDHCATCKAPIEEECIKFSTLWNWHANCFKCQTCQVDVSTQLQLAFIDSSKGVVYCKEHAVSSAIVGAERIRHLQQYITLLCNALSRLFSILKIDEKAIFPITQDFEPAQEQPQGPPKPEEFFDDEDVELQQTPSFRRPEQDNMSWKVPGEIDEKNWYISDITGLQSLASRQAAALALHKYIDKWISLEKLLQIADGPKSSLWSKMFGGKTKEKKKNRTFGTSLDVLVKNYGVDSPHGFGIGAVRIPILMQECVTNLKQQDLSTEGIFRKNGNIRRLKELCEQIDKDPLRIDLKQDNAIQIAALMKKFLRDLPDPLLTFALYDLFMCIPKIAKEDQFTVLHLIICLLPKPNIDLLSVLIRFLVEVASYSHGNKMDIPNLATVIAPNILYPKTGGSEHSGSVIDIVKLLLQYNKNIFKTPSVVKEVLNDPLETQKDEVIKKYEQNFVKLK